jgi:hypothetical protein
MEDHPKLRAVACGSRSAVLVSSDKRKSYELRLQIEAPIRKSSLPTVAVTLTRASSFVEAGAFY